MRLILSAILGNRIVQTILAILAAWGSIKAYTAIEKHKAVKADRAKRKREADAALEKTRKQADAIEDHVGDMSDDDVRRVLGERWTRSE